MRVDGEGPRLYTNRSPELNLRSSLRFGLPGADRPSRDLRCGTPGSAPVTVGPHCIPVLRQVADERQTGRHPLIDADDQLADQNRILLEQGEVTSGRRSRSMKR